MSKSNRSGELKGATTGTRRGTRSSNAASAKKQGNRHISDTLDITAQKSPNSQRTENLANDARMIQALADKMKPLAFWKKIELEDGSKCFALCFPVSKWNIQTGELVPNE